MDKNKHRDNIKNFQGGFCKREPKMGSRTSDLLKGILIVFVWVTFLLLLHYDAHNNFQKDINDEAQSGNDVDFRNIFQLFNTLRSVIRHLTVIDLKVFFTNARSMINKMDEVRKIAIDEGLDIIGIVESYTKKRHEKLIALDGYNLFQSYRKGKNSKGGVIMYVRDNIEVINYYCGNETVWVRINIQGEKMLIGNVYRTPNKSKLKENQPLYNTINKIMIGYDDVVLMGDFNFPNIDWERVSVYDRNEYLMGIPRMKCYRSCSKTKTLDNNAIHFLALASKHHLKQMVTDNTRVTDKTGAILDLILTNCEEKIKDVSVKDNLGYSDHSIIRFKIVVNCFNALIFAQL